jgi:hypothetical protein
MACSGPAAPAPRSKSDIRTTSTPTCANDEGQRIRVVARGGVCSARKAAAAPELATPPAEPGGSGSALLSSGRGEGSTSHVPPANRLGTALRNSWRDGRRPQRGEFGVRACRRHARLALGYLRHYSPAGVAAPRQTAYPRAEAKHGAHKRRPWARMSPEARMGPRRSRTCSGKRTVRCMATELDSTAPRAAPPLVRTSQQWRPPAPSCRAAAQAGIAEARRDQNLTSGADDNLSSQRRWLTAASTRRSATRCRSTPATRWP